MKPKAFEKNGLSSMKPRTNANSVYPSLYHRCTLICFFSFRSDYFLFIVQLNLNINDNTKGPSILSPPTVGGRRRPPLRRFAAELSPPTATAASRRSIFAAAAAADKSWIGFYFCSAAVYFCSLCGEKLFLRRKSCGESPQRRSAAKVAAAAVGGEVCGGSIDGP